jgi:hypothetical protein
MKRSELKKIVKECLLELLSEGLGFKNDFTKDFEDITENKKNIKNVKQINKNTNFLQKRTNDDLAPEHGIMSIARNATNDPILAEILQDTAMTTLKEKIKHEKNVMPLNEANLVSLSDDAEGIDIESMPNLNNWSKLAFND